MTPASPSHANTAPAHGPVVLQVIPALETGGVERGCVDVAVFLKRAGATPIVVSEGGVLVHELERNGILHITLPVASKNPLVMHANVGRLEAIIRDHGVDIIHARSRAPAWSAFFAAKRTGCHFMTTYHAAYKGRSAIKKLYNSIMARGERVIAISQFIAEHIVHTYPWALSAIRTVPRGIDLFKFNPNHVTGERMISLAQEWRLPDGRQVIFCPARLTRIKGHEVLLKALSLLERRDFICVLAGSNQGRDHYSDEIEQLAVDLQLEGYVSMVGDCSDMPTGYMLADVVVAPSIIAEGFGRVAVEAQAMGRPVVATALGGMMETVLPETGWLVRVNDPEDLAIALNEALNLTAEQRHRLAQVAIAHVHQRFSKDEMCWATLDVYQELYGKPVPWQQAVAVG